MRCLTFICSFSFLAVTFVLNNGSLHAEYPSVTELRDAEEIAQRERAERAQGKEQHKGTRNENARTGEPKSNSESGDNVDSKMDRR